MIDETKCVCERQLDFSDYSHNSSSDVEKSVFRLTLNAMYDNDLFNEDNRAFVEYKIVNYNRFVESLYYFILEQYEIYPREYESSDTLRLHVGSILSESNNEKCKSLQYDLNTTRLRRFACQDATKFQRVRIDHAHRRSKGGNVLAFCTEPEIAAALYVTRTTTGIERAQLLSSLKDWLPEVTIDSIAFVVYSTLSESVNDKCIVVSELAPTYALHYLYNDKFCVIRNELDEDNTRAKHLRYLVYHRVAHLDEFLEDGAKFSHLHSSIVSEIDDTHASIDNFEVDLYSLHNKAHDRTLIMKSRKGRSKSPSRSPSPGPMRRQRRSKRSRSKSPYSKKSTRSNRRKRGSRSRSSSPARRR
ncbi:gp72-like protein [Phenacoccus solenopsis nudivirus]|nr:gp72-like protein [Phenacoccus solenopsis nudivirus]